MGYSPNLNLRLVVYPIIYGVSYKYIPQLMIAGGTKSLQEDGVRRSEGCKVPGPSKIESKFVGWEELCQFPEGYIGTCMYCVCRCRCICIYIYMYYINIGLYIYLLYENVYTHTFWFDLEPGEIFLKTLWNCLVRRIIA